MIFSRLSFPYPVRICPPHMGTIPVPIEAAKLLMIVSIARQTRVVVSITSVLIAAP